MFGAIGTSMRAIDTVLFDLDDTLHDDTTAYLTAARTSPKASRASAGSTRRRSSTRTKPPRWRSGRRCRESISRGRSTTSASACGTRRCCAVGVADRALAQHCADGVRARAQRGVLELAPGSLDVLTALRERGCKLGMVTNGFAATHHDKIDRLGLRERMDAFFLADEVGMVKPDPELFRHACRVLGSEPARSAMVGDRYDRDVVGRARGGPVHGAARRPRDAGPGGAGRTGRGRHDDRRRPGRDSARTQHARSDGRGGTVGSRG